MAKSPQVEVMLARRPAKNQSGAFGHVDVDAEGRRRLHATIERLDGWARSRIEVAFHPDDEADEGEVLSTQLDRFDKYFQEKAAWSLDPGPRKAGRGSNDRTSPADADEAETDRPTRAGSR